VRNGEPRPKRDLHDTVPIERSSHVPLDGTGGRCSDPIFANGLKIEIDRCSICSEGSAARCSPFCNTERAKRPTSVPQRLPHPPKMDVPPRTTAVIASNSYSFQRQHPCKHLGDGLRFEEDIHIGHVKDSGIESVLRTTAQYSTSIRLFAGSHR
jgi:hypothetical protein